MHFTAAYRGVNMKYNAQCITMGLDKMVKHQTFSIKEKLGIVRATERRMKKSTLEHGSVKHRKLPYAKRTLSEAINRKAPPTCSNICGHKLHAGYVQRRFKHAHFTVRADGSSQSDRGLQ